MNCLEGALLNLVGLYCRVEDDPMLSAPAGGTVKDTQDLGGDRGRLAVLLRCWRVCTFPPVNGVLVASLTWT